VESWKQKRNLKLKMRYFKLHPVRSMLSNGVKIMRLGGEYKIKNQL
jgi:hypothetical protein